MRIYFVSFGTISGYTSSLARIKQQALDMNVFTDVFVYNDNDLKTHTDFWAKHGEFIESSSRGYGYWIWKPFLIHHIMQTVMVDGDILVYSDCGSSLRHTGLARLLRYFSLAMNSENGILGFELSYPEKQYTKMDVLDGLNAMHLADTKQIMATSIILCKNEISTAVINKWYIASTHHHYIDDSPSILPNSDVFIENRHDQSIYSVVLKLFGGTTLLGEETEINHPDYPIWNSRIRS